MKNKVFLTFFMIILMNFTVFAANSNEISENNEDFVNGVVRYAIYVGANDGGKGREKLLYAGSDAQSFKKTMKEIGGVEEKNSQLLINPTKETIDTAIADISEKISENVDMAKRSEFIFYYSGHSDENALLLGETVYDYSELKAAITDVPSDIHVVILDSCYSGNFIRTKGGQKRKPFLMDDSAVVKGHAYLSSSSDNEFSQESDEIESSYFTNAMISGLRGAADASGDNKVTLNELYSYAFNETLSKTENSKAGPQHPNYNITLVGSGDLVLSDLSTAESMLTLSKECKGRFIIRDKNEKLISEINKTAGQPIYMALPAGEYFVIIIDGNSTKQGNFVLEKDKVFVINDNTFSAIKRKSGRVRGDGFEEEAEKFDTDNSDVLDADDLENFDKKQRFADLEDFGDFEDEIRENNEEFDIKNIKFNDFNIIHFQPVPAVNVTGKSDATLISLGLIGSIEKAVLMGPQLSTVMNISPVLKYGVQTAGLFNINSYGIGSAQIAGLFNVSNNFSGAQVSGLFNVAEDMIGNQTAGLFNASGNFKGIQVAGGANFADDVYVGQIAGGFNFCDNLNGVQISGAMNVADNVNGVQISGFMNIADNVNGVQLGLFNISDEVNGISLGLFNFVKGGLMDLSFAWNTDDIFDFYYQGGGKHLYTVTGVLTSYESFKQSGFDFGAFYYGLGTQVSLWMFRFEAELLCKNYFFRNDDKYASFTNALLELKNESWAKAYFAMTVPSLRFNAHIQFGRFASMFSSVIFDYHKTGMNDLAFKLYHRENRFDFIQNDDIYVNFQFGFRVHL